MTEERTHSVEAEIGEAPDAATAETGDPGAPSTAPAGPAEDVSAEPASDEIRRPAGVPGKFWDPQAGTVRTEALLKSYLELERKLGSMVPLPSDEQDVKGHDRLRRALGVPDAAEDYMIDPPHELLQPDPEVNAQLLEAGFSQKQAQMVYDLAASHMLPLIDNTVAEVQASRDAGRLADYFGGEEASRAFARQIKTWGQANLPEDVMGVLASSYDGVIAMHQMMQAREPNVLSESSELDPGIDQTELARMMRDPRYWRDRDPGVVAEVTDGFKRLYPG